VHVDELELRVEDGTLRIDSAYLFDAINAAYKDGEITWLTLRGRRISAIVPADRLFNHTANVMKTTAAGERDAARARLLVASGITFSERQVDVLRARIAYPDWSWSRTAAYLSMTKAGAFGVWRTILARKSVQAIIDTTETPS
jgi:WhiA C-terminal HTH domain